MFCWISGSRRADRGVLLEQGLDPTIAFFVLLPSAISTSFPIAMVLLRDSRSERVPRLLSGKTGPDKMRSTHEVNKYLLPEYLRSIMTGAIQHPAPPPARIPGLACEITDDSKTLLHMISVLVNDLHFRLIP